MVIKRDYPLLADGLERIEYVSDSGFMIRKIGTDEEYSNAVELAHMVVEYEETDIIIEDIVNEEDYQNNLEELKLKAKAYDIITGGIE